MPPMEIVIGFSSIQTVEFILLLEHEDGVWAAGSFRPDG